MTESRPPLTIEEPGPPCRAFNLRDAMILLAAVAGGLTFAKTPLHYLVRNLRAIPYRPLTNWNNGTAKILWNGTDLPSLLGWLFASITPFLLFGSLAYLIMRFQMPRPTLRQVAWQPGMVAVELAAVLGANWLLVVLISRALNLGLLELGAVTTMVMLTFACTAPLSWTILALSGRWRPEPGWIDRMGRALGAAWTLAWLLIFSGNLLAS